MNKTELVEAIASNTNMTKTDVDKVITSFIEVVKDAL
ncbi:MAG: HU family DNA-binding protein, partial [Thomasclavelia spiroformis]